MCMSDRSMLNNESQVISLAQAMLALDVPYKSAQIILKGIKSKVVEESGKNLSLLGDAFMIAKEYEQAIKVMTQAASLTQQGKDFYKLAQIHTERQEWKVALKNVGEALSDENFKKFEDALILKGLILFNLNNLEQAKLVFQEAQKFDGTKKAAKQWLDYLNGESQRREYMAQQGSFWLWLPIKKPSFGGFFMQGDFIYILELTFFGSPSPGHFGFNGLDIGFIGN